MSKTTTFEAWAVKMQDAPTGFVKEPGNLAMPWITESSESAAGEALRQRRIGALDARMVRVRVTVETIEEDSAP